VRFAQRIFISIGSLAALALLLPALALAGPPLDRPKLGSPSEPPSVTAQKRDVPASRLLLPFYRVEQGNIFGLTTLWAVRNESLASIELTVRYFRPDRPQTVEVEEVFTLAPKEVKAINVRDVEGLFVDDDGFVSGYAVFTVGEGEGPIQGDFFLITPGEAFASGDRLVNIDIASTQYEPCQRLSLRYLNCGAFSGGTQLTVWVDTDQPVSPNEPLFFYSVYGEAGGDQPVFSQAFFAEEAAFRVPVSTLLNSPLPGTPPAFGAIEIEFSGELQGHVAAVMDANGLFSVGLKAACEDP
jgi:hypothetical protein